MLTGIEHYLIIGPPKGLVNDLVPSGNNPSPEPMLSQIYVAVKIASLGVRTQWVNCGR